jgi:hypothetical protein
VTDERRKAKPKKAFNIGQDCAAKIETGIENSNACKPEGHNQNDCPFLATVLS